MRDRFSFRIKGPPEPAFLKHPAVEENLLVLAGRLNGVQLNFSRNQI